jgi:hypothetical protein
MNIKQLFERIESKFIDDEINGNYSLDGNCIVWSYDLDNCPEETSIPYINEDGEEEEIFDFESISTEELLQEAYDEDHELLEIFLDEIEETENWSMSEPDILDNTISFKIF